MRQSDNRSQRFFGVRRFIAAFVKGDKSPHSKRLVSHATECYNRQSEFRRVGQNQSMSEPGSVTGWIKAFAEGDQEAAGRLWERYFSRLARVASAMMGHARRGAGDASDVALSALGCFFQKVQDGRFSDLAGRDELWRLLVLITKRKSINWIRHEKAAKRDEDRRQPEAWLADLVGSEPTPEFTAELLDEYQHLIDLLRQEDATLCLIAMRKAQGYTTKEIATELSLSPRSIQRKFKRICILWRAAVEERIKDA